MHLRRTVLRAWAGMASYVVPVGALTAFAQEDLPQPEVIGPIVGGAHGWPFGAYPGDIGDVGYVEEEYFLSGIARRFALVGPLTRDGMWSVEAIGRAPYKTRIVVQRPRDPSRFNGSVLVEWSNVSSGYDIFGPPPGVY